MVNTLLGFQQTYGYWEARILASPGGKDNLGNVPAFWLPNVLNNGDDGHGEIDVMEVPGGLPFGNGRKVWGTVHKCYGGTDECQRAGNVNASTLPDGDEFFSERYHDYAVLWQPGLLRWFVDGVEFFRSQEMVPSTPAYLVFDNEIGLGHLSDEGNNSWAGDPSGSSYPQEMLGTPAQPCTPARNSQARTSLGARGAARTELPPQFSRRVDKRQPHALLCGGLITYGFESRRG